MMFQGMALLAANGNVITIGQDFSWFGTFRVGPFPIQIIIFLALVFLVFFVMKYTKYGRRIYAVGGNAEAAFLAGINVRHYKMMVFIVNGLMCSISAMIVLSKLSAANPNMAVGYEMESITACVAGGVSLMGGRGNTLGCFMGIIQNSLNLLMVPIFYHKIIIGIVLLIAVILRTGRSEAQAS
jgi:ribose/xylose/arabinose/galactoside ABC-type transport system permease subunit